MAKRRSRTVLEFEVRSTDPDRQTIEAVREVAKLSADFQAAVEKRYPGVKVKIKRAEGLPVEALIHHLLVSIDWHAVASGVEKAISAFAATEFLKFTKKRVRNLFASPVTPQQLPVSPTSKKLVERGTAAKKVTRARMSPLANKVVSAKKSLSPQKRVPKKSSANIQRKRNG